MRRIRLLNLLGSSEDFDCVTLKFTWFPPTPLPKRRCNVPMTPLTPHPTSFAVNRQSILYSPYFLYSVGDDWYPPPQRKILRPNCILKLLWGFKLFVCLSVFRVFPLEWTESNPNFLLTLLDQFNIEGKEEIKDLFVKVGSKAIFSNSCH